MNVELQRNNPKSKEFKQDLLFVLKELLVRNKLTEIEYYRAVASVREGKY